MRLSPVYQAAKELQNSTAFPHRVHAKETQDGTNYFLVELPDKATAPINLGGETYEMSRPPHLSCYERFRPSETRGLSVMHITWYGRIRTSGDAAGGGAAAAATTTTTTSAETNKTKVKLHIYINQAGTLAYCQAKDSDSGDEIRGITITEVARIGREILEPHREIFTTLLMHASTELRNADEHAQKSLAELETLDPARHNEKGRYVRLAKDAIAAIKLRDTWSFMSADPRAHLLSRIVDLVLSNQTREPTPQRVGVQKAKKKTPPKANKNVRQKDKPKGKVGGAASTDTELQQLNEAVKAIDAQIAAIGTSDSAQALLEEKSLLERKLTVLEEAKCPIPKAIEDQLLIDLQKINRRIQKVFDEAAMQGNLDAVVKLTPHVSKSLDIIVVFETTKKLHLEVVKHFLEHFDNYMFIINQCCCGTSDDDVNGSSTVPIIYVVIYLASESEEGFQMLKFLLENGADANFRSPLGLSATHSPLCVAVQYEDKRVVRLLLEHGALFTPRQIGGTQVSDPRIFSSARQIRKIASQQLPGDEYKAIEIFPLHRAVQQGSVEIVVIFIEFSAPLEQRTKNMTPIGQIGCLSGKKMNREMIATLVSGGANINAWQWDNRHPSARYTPLEYHVQQGNEEDVRFLIEHGADPNREIVAIFPGNQTAITNSLCKATTKGFTKILTYLLGQKTTPVRLESIVLSLGYVIHKNVSIHLKANGHIHVGLNSNELSDCEKLLIMAIQRMQPELAEFQLVLTKINELATRYYQEKKFILAETQFHVIVLYGDRQQTIKALFNIGCCQYAQKEYEAAKSSFQFCVETKEELPCVEQASQYLKRIEAKELRATSAGRAAR